MNNIAAYFKRPLFLLSIPLLLYFAFSVYHLTKFETADEHFWFNEPAHDRIHQYWNAVAQHNWIATRINDKPGISLVFISGAGLLFEKTILKGSEINFLNVEQMNFAYRFPQVVFTALASLYFFWALRRITKSDFLTLLSVSLILLSPILIGISQIVNPDSMLWIFSFATVLAFFLYLQEEKKLHLFLATIFFAMALLSKYAALMLVPFFLAMLGFQIIFKGEKWSIEKLKRKIFKFSMAYFGLIFGGFLFFSILMPAVLVDPMLAYKGTVGFKGMQYVFWPVILINLLLLLDSATYGSQGAAYLMKKSVYVKKIFPVLLYVFLSGMFLLVLVNWSVGNNFMNVLSVAFDSAEGSKYQHASLFDQLMLQFKPIVFSLSPLVLVSVLFLWIKAIFKKIEHDLLVYLFSLFVLVYYIAVMRQGLLISIRYGIIMYPILLTLAGFGFFEMFLFEKKSALAKIAIFAGVIGISVIGLWQIKPFYFNYTNVLMPKNNIITGAWGYGGYEAAQYLNSLPDAKNIVVWSDYYGVCPFFVGKCMKSYALNDYVKKDSLASVGYVVATRRGKKQNINMWKKFNKYELKNTWSLFIGKRENNFVRVYENKGLNLSN